MQMSKNVNNDVSMTISTGFVRVMKNLESRGVYNSNFQAWIVIEFN